MIRSIYTATSGSTTRGNDMYDMLAHNLANVETPGFRAQYMNQTTSATTNTGAPGTDYQVSSLSAFEDKRPGQAVYTGEKLDVDTDGDTYLVVTTGDGLTAYSRNGRLKVQADGTITDRMGNSIQAENGTTLNIPPRAVNITIDEKGFITADGVRAGRLKVVSFAPGTETKPIGGGLYQVPVGVEADPADVKVTQGYYERSNVDPVQEMVRMLEVVRSVESYTKFILAASEDTTAPLVKGTGRVG